MQLCGQALRFFTGLQLLIKRVTTDYIRSMRSHDIMQTFSSETRRSLLHGVRVLSSRVSKARRAFSQLSNVKTTVYAVRWLVERVRIVSLGFVLIFLACNHICHCGAETCARLHFSFYAAQRGWQIYIYIYIRRWWLRPQTWMHKHVWQISPSLANPPPSHILPGLIYNAKVMMSGRVSRPKKRD